MTSIDLKCDNILDELYKFSGDILFLGEPILDKRLEELEDQIGFNLPLDFKYLLKKHNSFSLGGTEVNGLGLPFKAASLDQLYYNEHEEVGNPMLKEFLPFSPDGRGNHYCLDLLRLEDNECPIVFWQHDCDYLYREDVKICNNSFTEWIKEVMIDWTLDDTNYDGSEKS